MSVPFLGDYNTIETVKIPFNTFSSNDPSASVTVTDLIAGDVEIHKDGNTTQRTSDNGVTVAIDFDSVTGNHIISIDLSDNSDAGFYSAGSRYQIRLEGITVDGATLNVWIGTFSIGCSLRPVTNGRTIAVNGSGAVTAGTVGDKTGYSLTQAFPTNFADLSITGTTGLIDITQTAANKIWSSTTRTLTAFSTALALSVWNVLESAIVTGSSIGLKVKNNLDVVLSSRSSHTASAIWAVGTRLLTAGTNIVLAKGTGITGFNDFDASATPVELLTTGGTAGKNAEEIVDDFWDELLTGATHNINNSAGKRLRQIQVGAYNGFVWIDTVDGIAGDVPNENGTIDNPVSNIADATTLAVSLNLKRLSLAPGSSIILTQAYTNYIFSGHGWTLDLGGQDISDSIIMGAGVSGTSVGSDTHYVNCDFGTVLLSSAHAHGCAFIGPITLGSSGDYFFVNCYSAVAGISAPIFDFDAIAGSTNVNLRHYSGGVDVRNMGQVGTDNMSLEGAGQLIMNVNCIGGTVAIRGNFTLTNNGATTISDAARFDGDVNIKSIDTSTQAATNLKNAAETILTGTVDDTTFTPTTTQFEVSDITEATTDHMNGRILTWNTGSLAKQQTDITGYELANSKGKFTVTGMTEAPINGDTFTIT